MTILGLDDQDLCLKEEEKTIERNFYLADWYQMRYQIPGHFMTFI